MTTTTKHTPGPWYLGMHNGANPGYQTIKVDGTPIAKALGATQDEVKANAALIAAAPELLEALREAANDVEQLIEVLETVPGCASKTGAHRKSVAIYRAAIAKAEGRS